MAPSRKEQYEKNAWSWVENCRPSEISDEHVRTAYRINLSRCKIGACRRNCRGNPFCLSNLGEHRWLGSHEDYSDHVCDPEKERRKYGSYVGLKNLGATCYVNSLLQLWFHNRNFRKAIFMWDPLQDPEDKQNITILEETYVPVSVLGHLQAVFALLRYGERRFVDPTDFILSLRLDTSIQQDAQEFSKLFLSKLETTLSYQSAKEVRDLIKDNFCGEYSYVTRCMKCKMESKRPSTFYELDLNIKGHKTIQDCLREFMNIEMLEGDDKYFCQICGEKQDAQRFISLTELPPVLNLQLMRFVFDKNTGYKKKLNTFVQFPDKLNMSEFCPNVKGDMEYTLSAVLVHGGRSANSGHYVAHICDSESGTWYKFNDESVEKIEGKKLKLGTEDEYEDGGKKMKIPRAPKGSYHSPNAYMLVYTRNDVASTPLRNETYENGVAAEAEAEAESERTLPSHLQNFVHDQNLQFENWVTDVQKTNDMAVGRNHFQQLEMATNITLLSVESGCDNLEAVPTSWLTRWLSDPEQDSAIDNEKYSCSHAKLDPNEVSNVKYINSEMADKLFDKYGGEPRFKYKDFLCRDCVIAKCLKIRVKNQTQHEFKIISNKLKAKFCETEMGYWVGKLSLRSWRRMALENLENGVLDRNSIESLLNDTEVKPVKGIGGAGATATVLCKSEENEAMRTESKQPIILENNETTKCKTRQFHVTNGRTDFENTNAPVIGAGRDEKTERKPKQRRTAEEDSKSRYEHRLSPRCLVISKLEECYSVSVSNRNDPLLGDLCEPLKDVLNRAKNIGDGSQQESTAATTVSSYNGAYRNFLQNRDKTLLTNSTDDDNAEIGSSTKSGDGKNHDAPMFSEGSGGGDDDRCHSDYRCYYDNDDGDDNDYDDDDDDDNNDNDDDDDVSEVDDDNDNDNDNDDDGDGYDEDEAVRHGDPGRRRRRQRRRRRDRLFECQRRQHVIENGGGGEDDDDNNANNTIEMVASAAHQVNESQSRLNGNAMATSACRTECVVDNEDDGSNSETKFNDDLLCFHGNLCVEENGRKLVPEQVWRLLKKYFPYANEFTSLSQPCGLCKSIASEAEVAKDMYKTGAVNQKESLSDLYLDRNRPPLDYHRTVGSDVENVFYLINKEFINSWRKFIRENGKKEPPYSIKNQSWLLCADHSGLLYDLNQRIPNTIVVITRKEWQLLCAAYNADCEISVKCMPDGTVVTSPDVCLPCMRRRIENEEKAQLCYSKAKIYIKIQNDEEAEYLSNEESRPPTKRAKLSTYNGGSGTSIVNGNGNGNGNGCLHRMNGGGGGGGGDGIPGAAAGAGAGAGGSVNGSDASSECRVIDFPSVERSNHASRQNSVAITIDHSTSGLVDTTRASACKNEATDAVSVADPAIAVRRSSRCRRVRGVKEIVVSSDLTLLDVKKKICEMMSVAPMDQHLFTCDGRSLTENTATLTELSIYPETILNLKVDEPCEGVIADEFIVDREPEAGFKGTGLVGS